MSNLYDNILLILDDREFATDEVCRLVGPRRFGDIIFKRRKLIEHFQAALPEWARARLVHLRTAEDLNSVRALLETSNVDTAACIIAGRAGFIDPDRLTQLIERLPYAVEDFTDCLYHPLIVFMRNAHQLIDQWADLEAHQCIPGSEPGRIASVCSLCLFWI